jgi:4-hydroxy-tetrahydrodipicolinate synthase
VTDLNRFHGIVPAMATAFTEDESVDHGRVRELVEWYIDCGVHGISIAGSQGEFFALDPDEHRRLLEVCVEAVAGRVPVYAGTGGVTTRAAIRMTREAEAMGADLALVITPYFIQPTQDELVEHYTRIAAATGLPVMLYNNPPRTATNMPAATLARCMKARDNIIGMKDSSGDLTQAIEYLLLSDRKALLFSGRDTLTLSMLVNGAHGAISPAANVFPRLAVRMYDAFRSGSLDEARRISDAFAPLRAAWAMGSFPVVIKEAMALVGHSAGPTRAPIAALPASRREELAKIVRGIGELEAR